MLKSIMLGFSLMVNSAAVDAVLVDHDGYARDTSSGLDWLDFTITQGQSYEEVISETQGGSLIGWRYATRVELEELSSNIGVPIFGNQGTRMDSDLPNLLDLLGVTHSDDTSRVANLISGNEYFGNKDFRWSSRFVDGDLNLGYVDHVLLEYGIIANSASNPQYASALVRVVPLPSASVMFFSAFLLPLMGQVLTKCTRWTLRIGA